MAKVKLNRRKRTLRRRPPKKDLDFFVKEGLSYFWFVQGLNYLASSYEESIWSPLFEIYSDTDTLPNLDVIHKKVNSYLSTNNNPTMHFWLQLDAKTLYELFLLAANACSNQNLLEAHNDKLWRFFEELRQAKSQKRPMSVTA